MIISHINHYFENNDNPILEKKIKTQEALSEDETVKKIIEVLDTKIRPAVARDGGDIKFQSFEKGVVKVELRVAALVVELNNDIKTRSSKSFETLC